MKYYLDTEFYEDGRIIDLISIGIACEDGRRLYAINQDAELHRVNDWVRANVLPQLPSFVDSKWMPRVEIRRAVNAFTSGTTPEFWAYYADYDWVVFCQLFGTMMDLPVHMPKFCMDLKQLAVSKGNPELPKQESGEHNALEDACWNMRVHAFLESYVPSEKVVL